MMVKFTHLECLSKLSLLPLHENQSIYLSKDLCEFTPRRQWPNITLPIPASIPPQPATVGPNTQLIRAMQATHDTAADILRSQGTDPCAVYREKQVKYILNHVESGHKKCKVCSKELSSTHKLKSHIRATHCHSAAYKCSILLQTIWRSICTVSPQECPQCIS